MHSPEELKELVEEALEELELWPELQGQTESVRYALEMGGKRIRPVITLAVGEALDAGVPEMVPMDMAPREQREQRVQRVGRMLLGQLSARGAAGHAQLLPCPVRCADGGGKRKRQERPRPLVGLVGDYALHRDY